MQRKPGTFKRLQRRTPVPDMAQRLSLYATAVLLAFLLINLHTASAQGSTRFERFKECIQKCSDLDAKCNDAVSDLWVDFLKNKKQILRHLRKCCLQGELREDAEPEDSFAACARVRCGAVLWGYVSKNSNRMYE